MMRRINPWAVGAIAFCAAAWALAGAGGAKMTGIYAARGPHGFRYALEARLDYRLHELKRLVVETKRSLA
jgi:hypothetical protein